MASFTKRDYSEFLTPSFNSKKSKTISANALKDSIPRNSAFKPLRLLNTNIKPCSEKDSSFSTEQSEFYKDPKFNKQSFQSEVKHSGDENFNSSTCSVPVSSVVPRKVRSLSRPGSFSSSRRYLVSREDLVSRERCYDYIIQCIDEVWARYCDTTSSAEAMVYGNVNGINEQFSSHYHHSSKALTLSDDDETEYEDNESTVSFTESKYDYSDGEYDGYKSETTNATEYETDSSEHRTVSKLPDSMKLESLKCRLTKAKNDLEQFYDSDNYSDCVAFWQRWDMIKYRAVEVMEEDDDDEVVQATLEELEAGRCFYE
ncbi:hypothetical protein KAFR_0D00200 [Kazachstania africana CBS 2517]|uniref:Uncharacterized protein n=1 Tax=Kazachstania africana (strain ATCC 22294 / BCRC 22015 / CBS 2517 / CECT 1963 / NBRC 1671 / NRRL Y-8276) TaxID=1071382 RepID=H2ATG6_KAZAF|nr:hypothetical protein KAFR_0D00200 [Kazachstania africana CBS 2517]CCF57666.1 hypothetical protein KAFR_0D00200 [Kazachstania africana CBS 2517]